MVGRNIEILPSPERPKRWLIKAGEYARINVPDVWKAWQYPVRYMSLEELGIDPTALKFEPMETPTIEHTKAPKLGDVIESAKQQIAAAAGVPNAAVRISVDLS